MFTIKIHTKHKSINKGRIIHKTAIQIYIFSTDQMFV